MIITRGYGDVIVNFVEQAIAHLENDDDFVAVLEEKAEFVGVLEEEEVAEYVAHMEDKEVLTGELGDEE